MLGGLVNVAAQERQWLGLVQVAGKALAAVKVEEVASNLRLMKQRALWAEAERQRRMNIEAFLAQYEGSPSAHLHRQLAERQQEGGVISEEQCLKEHEELEEDIQKWQKEEMVKACGGATAVAAGRGGESIPAAAGATPDTAGLGGRSSGSVVTAEEEKDEGEQRTRQEVGWSTTKRAMRWV